MALANDAMVLAVLRPLLEAGIFQFLSPFYAACQACSDAWHTRIENLAKSIFEEIRSDLNAKLVGESIEIRTEGFFGTPMIQLRKLLPDEQHALKSGTKLESIVQKVMESELCGQIGSTLHALRDASSLGAITFSDSRVSLMAARDMDGLRPPYTEIENWEASRSATLPWIGDLSMEQVVILREEADSALPRFRERLQTLMTAPQKDTKIDSAAIASELRAEAAEVEAELGALNMKGRNRARNARGILGLTVAVYGFAGEFMDPALALTGLSVLLHQLHESHSKDAQQENLLHSQPAYVLAKAKELTQHAEGDS